MAPAPVGKAAGMPSCGRAVRTHLARVLWFGVVASAAALAFAFLFPHDFRRATVAYLAAAWIAFMIRTFSFHLGLVLAAGALVAAGLRRFRLTVVAALLSLWAAGPEVATYGPRLSATAGHARCTVMSLNLLRDNDDSASVLAEILRARPDIVALQEYTPRWRAALEPALADDYRFRHHVERDDCFGLAVYSRWPVVEVDDALPLGRFGLPQQRAVIEVQGRRLAFYNLHLWPPKGLHTMQEQRQALADLLELLAREELPVVLAGDFNFTKSSAMADELARRGLRDVHDLAGRGRGSTWPVHGPFWLLPGLRLDHIYISSELTAVRAWTGARVGSDHRAVIAEIALP